MSANYYHMCSRGIGRAVHIRTRDGQVHRGIIHRVSPNRLFLRPLGDHRSYGGYGYGWGGGFGFGFATGIALGAIVSFAFIPFFF